MDAGHPIQYAGFGSGGGHTFVCDGYDQNNFFHMNWGWGGQEDGFFELTALNPGSLGIGGGDGGFNSDEQALVGIIPVTNTAVIASDLQLNSAITVTPTPIDFLGAFTVNADIINNTANNFNGTFSAMLFTASGDFIKILDTVPTTTLATGANFTGGLTFSSPAFLTVPGNYTISINYKPTGGNWYQVGSTNYSNPVTVAINSPSSDIELYSDMVPSSVTYTQGSAGSVTVNIENTGGTSFIGEYQVDLVDPQTGFVVEVVGSYTETTGLASGSHYPTPITFSTTNVNAAPGTYILTVTYQAAGDTVLYYAGGSNYTNPVNIDVIAADILPDVFEANDTVGQAHAFTVSFANTVDSIVTTGSNIHLGTDVDFYKFDLPTGTSYQVSSVLYDETYAAGGSYNLIALTSYSLDGGATWAATYGGGIIPDFYVPNGGPVYFEAAPYFAGNVGNYMLKVTITSGVVGIANLTADATFSVFPNPATSSITVKTDGDVSTLTISDLQGREVLTQKLTQATTAVDVSQMSKGMYLVKLQDSKQVTSKKIIIQ